MSTEPHRKPADLLAVVSALGLSLGIVLAAPASAEPEPKPKPKDGMMVATPADDSQATTNTGMAAQGIGPLHDADTTKKTKHAGDTAAVDQDKTGFSFSKTPAEL